MGIEKDQRDAFLLKAYRQFGETLVRINEQRENGKIVSHDPHELIGEIPSEVPGQIVFNKDEIDPPSLRLQALREVVRRNGKRIVIAGVAGTGVVVATIGTIMAVKHFVDQKTHSDITDK